MKAAQKKLESKGFKVRPNIGHVDGKQTIKSYTAQKNGYSYTQKTVKALYKFLVTE